MEQSKPATRHHIYRAIAAAVTEDPPPPKRVNFVEPVANAAPILCLDLYDHEDARAWAAYLALDDPGSVLVGRNVTSIAFTGMWLGWRVLLTGEEPTEQAVAAAAVVA